MRNITAVRSKSIQERLSQLPVALTSFIGREKEIVEIKRRLGNTRVFTLTGAGGSGKTRLALQVCAEIERERVYEDGVRWVELAPLSDPALVPEAIAKVLGVSERSGRTLTDLLLAVLREKALLLVLDNCEHLVDACAEFAQLILEQCPDLYILATSREALNIEGEQVWIVPSLTLPAQSTADLYESDAAHLFIERASAAQPNFKLSNDTAAFVAQICRRLDGIPLAIELAAARVKVLSVEQIAARLDDAMRLLTEGKRTAPRRHQTLLATMDWSYDLLSTPEQVLFNRLSVFAGSFTLEAAEKVCADDLAHDLGNSLEVLDLLSHLLDKSLVVLSEHGETRYRMLETVRQYAWEKLLKTGEAERFRDLHLSHFSTFAEEADSHFFSAEELFWNQRFELEHANLLAALGWSLDGARIEAGLRLSSALWKFWLWRSYFTEAAQWYDRLLARANDSASQARHRALLGAAWMALKQGKQDKARALAETSITLAREAENQEDLADALAVMAFWAMDQGDLARASALFEESLALSRELGPRSNWRTALSLAYLGELPFARGDYGTADALAQQSLNLFREIGSSSGTAYALEILGDIAERQGNYSKAKQFLKEALTLHRQLKNMQMIADALQELAIVARGEREFVRAVRLWAAADALRQELNQPAAPFFEAYRPYLNSLRDKLGENRFAAAWAQGQSLSLEQAVNYALDELTVLPEAFAAEDEPRSKRAGKDQFGGLTAREREVAALIAQGKSNRAIARQLVVSVKTVEAHITRILSKLGFTSRAQIAGWAIQKGLAKAPRDLDTKMREA